MTDQIQTLTRPQSAVILSNVSRQQSDREYVNRAIFQDYINKRDQLRQRLEWPDLALPPEQADQVLTLARMHFRQRESEDFKRWLVQFFVETNSYLTNIKISSWPLMRNI